jgi:hypothetical protein
MFPDYKYWKDRAPLRGESPSFRAINMHFRPKFRAANPDFSPRPSAARQFCMALIHQVPETPRRQRDGMPTAAETEAILPQASAQFRPVTLALPGIRDCGSPTPRRRYALLSTLQRTSARHECGTKICREKGIEYARRLPGHANISTTQRYMMHLDECELADAQDLVE